MESVNQNGNVTQSVSSHQNLMQPILQQQSLNVKRLSSQSAKQQDNLIDNSQNLKNISQSTTASLIEPQICQKYEHLYKNSTISDVIAEIDDIEKDDLLLSSSTIKTEDLISNNQTICKVHGKVEDIICLVQKTKICCFCALFGPHKDHTFKSEPQLIQEIENIEVKMRETDKKYRAVESQFRGSQYLQVIEEYCEKKKQELSCQLQEQINGLIQKIQKAKDQIKVKTLSKYDELMKKIGQNWQSTSKNLKRIKEYDTWRQSGLTILRNISQKLQGYDLMQPFKQYQKFHWDKGANIIDQYNEILKNFIKRSQQSFDDIKFNNSYSLKSILLNTLQFDSQKTIQFQLQTPPTSLQQLHKQLNFTYKGQLNDSSLKNEFLQSKQKIRIRHSQLIQSTLQPIQEEISKVLRAHRNSFNSGSKKIRNDSYIGSNSSFCSALKRQTSNSRLQQTFKSPKSRASIYKSPSHYKTSRNPVEILSSFEKNKNQTSLNLSNCGLKNDQILYFVEKAFNSHVPIDLNLQKNKLSISGLAKLLPFLSKVVSVNLSKTQIDQSCLDVLLKIKGVKRLYQINLSQNDISQYHNQAKLQNLKKMGLKIII